MSIVGLYRASGIGQWRLLVFFDPLEIDLCMSFCFGTVIHCLRP